MLALSKRDRLPRPARVQATEGRTSKELRETPQAKDARVLGGLALLTLLSGVAVLVFAGGLLASVVAIVLLGLSGIALVALVFLLVGQGEERDRRRHPRG